MIIKNRNSWKTASDTWEKVFIIFPSVTMDNELIYLEYVYRKWKYDLEGWCDAYSGYSGYDGGWEYSISPI